MQTKLFIVLLISLLIAAAVFATVREMGSFLVWRYYLNESSKQERAEKYVERFQEYVIENKLAVDDSKKISDFDEENYVDLIIYKDSNLVYASEWFEDYYLSGSEGAEGESETSDSDETEAEETGEVHTETSSELVTELVSEIVNKSEFYENWFSGDRGFEQYLTEEAREEYGAALAAALEGNNRLQPVYFLDGTLLVTVVDYTEEIAYNLVFAVSIILAFAVIAVIMIFYFSRMARRIRKLAKDVRRVEKGALDMPIRAAGDDEIAALAGDVNSMRNAIVENMTKERQAWEANVGLITAMSHDIRTPLTVLLGYLDIIEMQSSDDTNAEYIAACRENAMRLKTLSDDMFSYFLVFGKSEEKLDMVSREAEEWLSHMISEHVLLLGENGYSFNYEGNIPKGVYLRLDERYFSRVIDNIFSNISKYADADEPVKVYLRCVEDEVVLTFENKIRRDKSTTESNKIGLKTCVKMMEKMKGRLLFGVDGNVFTVSVFMRAEGENADSTDS
jgi:signal transduction histidine kinase